MDQYTGTGGEKLHISDVMEVIQNDEIGGGNDGMQVKVEENGQRNLFSTAGAHSLQNESPLPYIEILEQPASGIRFRYEIEGRSAGSIPGERSRPEMKTYPTVRVVGYTGKMLIVVSCVTVEENPKSRPKPHPHKLVGKAEYCKNGVCQVRLKGENMTVSFPNLGIQCVRRKDVEASLSERQREKVDPFGTGFEHKKGHINIALNAVRLCFQGFIPKRVDGKISWDILNPVVSNPIIEKKATCTLSIHKLSHYSASVGGGMEMILLCDKVPKDDIQIRFFEERDGLVIWEGYGDFQPTQVHHQYAIAFRTPKYENTDIKEPVRVNVQLKLKNKEQYGPALDFEMLPLGTGRPAFWSLRKAFAKKKTDYSTFDKLLSSDATSFLSHSNPKIPRNIDEFNNNDLNLKRSQDKFSALRALNDLYNVRNNFEAQNEIVEIRSAFKTADSKKSEKSVDLENNEISIISVKEPEENPAKMIGLEILQNSNQVRNVNLGESDSSPKSLWINNNEVGKWVQKTQEFRKSEEASTDNQNGKMSDDRSLNELLSQVAELDQIYADTQTKLLDASLKISNERETELDIRDNMTYTSLQMAMKNPIELFDLTEKVRNYDDVPVCSPIISIAPAPLTSAKRDVASDFDERLPPLPPKRIRKTPSMPVLPRSGVFQTPMETAESTFGIGAPNKNLPSPPGTLPKQAKQGLFSKLFAKKQKKEKDSCVSPTTGSNRSLNVTGSISSLKNDELDVHQLPRPSMASITGVRSLRLDGDESPPYGVELTEAENYALYTDMAPHATVSEFDEMSFYYSPVEGGKILVKDT